MPATNSRTSWYRFPQELRYAILQILLHDGCPLAPLATVSKEWQEVIERHNFARIKLTRSRLAEFGSVIHRNRSLVRYIWLCVELARYGCASCKTWYPYEWELDDEFNTLPHAAILSLFSTLSTWEETSCGLFLDISAYSPSDSEHWFKYLTFEPDTSSDELSGRIQQSPDQLELNDFKHGWMVGSRRFVPCALPIHRLFEEVSEGAFDRGEEKWWNELPLVPVVTGVLLRQQNRRRWNPTTLARVFGCLPRLQELHYEPWREWDTRSQRLTDAHYRCLLKSLASSKLRRLVLFENSNQDYIPSMKNIDQLVVPLGGSRCDPVRIPTSDVGVAVAKISLQLEYLSASFIVDAEHFFEACQPSWRWSDLTSLALTSRILTPKESLTEINNMIRRAAAVAMSMPNLGTMEIWNGREGLAMLFRYQTTRDGRAVITWRGTWGLTLEPSVIQAWKDVALTHGRRRFIIAEELLADPSIIGCHGDAIHHLKLSSQVIRPISLQQIRAAHSIPRGRASKYIGPNLCL